MAKADPTLSTSTGADREGRLANSALLIPASWRKTLALLRVLVAAYAFSAADGSLGVAIAAAYIVFAAGMSWTGEHERERLDIATFCADALFTAAAAASDNYFLFCCCLSLLAAHVVIVTIHKRRLDRHAYQLNRKSVMYRAEAIQARAAERERLATDFHDGPMQIFMSFQMRLEVLHKLLERDRLTAAAELAEFQQSVAQQVDEMRVFLHRARDTGADIEETDLFAAARLLAGIFERDTGVKVDCAAQGDSVGIEEKRVLEMLHIIREALHNIYKHAEAKRIGLTIDAADTISIGVEDDGKGFPFRGAYKLDELDVMRMGPRTIKLRVRDLGGDMMLESRPGQGSRLMVRIPR